MVKKSNPERKDSKSKAQKIKKTQTKSEPVTMIAKKPIGRPRKTVDLLKNNEEQLDSTLEKSQPKKTLASVFIDFFAETKQNDLVFKQSIRKVLDEHYPDLKIKPEHDWNRKEEGKKIEEVLDKLEITSLITKFDRTQIINRLREFFFKASKFFASQVTSQLYDILSTITTIVSLNLNNRTKMIEELRNFGDEIPSLQRKKRFFYFGFNMFQLRDGQTEQDIKHLVKHNPHYKYVLREKYRQSGGPYSRMIESLGQLIQVAMFSEPQKK